MENSIEIRKEDLKKILFLLVDKLEASDNNKFLLDKDLYWSIPDEKLYDIYKEPVDLTMGSLVEDWEFLQKILRNERDVVGCDFNKISNILRLIAQSNCLI